MESVHHPASSLKSLESYQNFVNSDSTSLDLDWYSILIFGVAFGVTVLVIMAFCVVFDNRNCLKKSKSGRIYRILDSVENGDDENVENPTNGSLASGQASGSMPSLESAS